MRTQPDWMKTVKVGDVLARPGRPGRVVRCVSRFKNGDLCGVAFTIKGCSWTQRCYTSILYNDLRLLGYEPTGATYAMKARLDKRIARDLQYENRFNQKLDCCDVRGVA